MKKIFIFLAMTTIFLSGCLLKTNTNDVIKITSENQAGNINIKVNKTLSLSTGINLLESGDVDEAIKFFQEYEDFYSKNSKFYYYFAQAYFKKGLYLKASDKFEKALAIDNKKTDLFLNIAQAYEKANNKNKAVENYINYVFRSEDTSKNIEIRNKLNNFTVQKIGNNIIGRISLTDRAEIMKNSAIGMMQAFNPDTPMIFASVEIINAKKSDKIKIKWNFLSAKEEIIPVNSTEFNVLGAKTVLLSIKSPVSGWPTGKYEMRLFVNGVENSSLKFYVF